MVWQEGKKKKREGGKTQISALQYKDGILSWIQEFREYQKRNEYTTEGLTVASIKLVETILYETESTGLFTKITRKWFIQRKEDSIVIQDPLNPLFRIS